MEISEKPRMFDLESVSIKQQIIATKLSNPIKQSKIITHPKKKFIQSQKNLIYATIQSCENKSFLKNVLNN